MNDTTLLLLFAVIIFIVDLPWLNMIGGSYSSAVQIIQGGSPMKIRPAAGIIVYLALSFLLLQTTSLKNAFLTGAAVYAVYDFTLLTVFKDYPLWIALLDTLWGGILLSIAYWIRQRLPV